MKVLFVGNILPREIATRFKTSIAANKFELSFTKALDKQLHGGLDVISISEAGYSKMRKSRIKEVYPGKPFSQVIPERTPGVQNIVRGIHFFWLAFQWCVRNRAQDKVILINNSPVEICLVSLLMKLFGTKVVSFTIDTPFTSSNRFKGILGWYAKTLFRIGHYTLRFFSGIIVLNKRAVVKLNLRIPYLAVQTGYDEEIYDFDSRKNSIEVDWHTPKKAVFAGTLIDYNGVITLAKAFGLLPTNDYVLHIYGSGPLEPQIRTISNENSNVVFHGLIDNERLLKILSEADLLINPRVTTASVCDFTFPSKLTEYILSGRPVLTTNFSSMPEEYKRFVFLIEDETPEGFCRAIERVFSEEEPKRIKRCNDAVEYIHRHQSWEKISKDVHNFIKSL